MENSQTPQMLAMQPEETGLDFQPKTFDDYIGQETLKEKLGLYAQAATMRKEPLDHILLFGPPGLGKTTLAHVIANQMDVGIKTCSGPMLERTGDLVSILSGLEPRDILFIDEIHRMPMIVEEVLYSAMETYSVDVIIGQGPGAQTITVPINPFTLIGATTKSGTISAPLRSRFGINERLEFYDRPNLAKIIKQNAQHLDVTIENDAANLLAQCSRGTPRIAKKLIRRIRDFAQVHNNNQATLELVKKSLAILGIDQEGLTPIDRAILETLVKNYKGGPAGLETIASLVGEEAHTIEEVYEPYLLRQGYLEKTPRGRKISPRMYAVLRKKLFTQNTGQSDIF